MDLATLVEKYSSLVADDIDDNVKLQTVMGGLMITLVRVANASGVSLENVQKAVQLTYVQAAQELETFKQKERNAS